MMEASMFGHVYPIPVKITKMRESTRNIPALKYEAPKAIFCDIEMTQFDENGNQILK
jgi:hypothetical protein